jgi:hypothetical protein
MVSHTMGYSKAWLNNDLDFMSVRLMRLCFFVPISLPRSHRETRMQRRNSQRIDLQVAASLQSLPRLPWTLFLFYTLSLPLICHFSYSIYPLLTEVPISIKRNRRTPPLLSGPPIGLLVSLGDSQKANASRTILSDFNIILLLVHSFHPFKPFRPDHALFTQWI